MTALVTSTVNLMRPSTEPPQASVRLPHPPVHRDRLQPAPFLSSLAAEAGTYSPEVGELLARNVGDLLTTVVTERLGRDAAPTDAGRQTLLQRIRHFINAHLADPALSAEAIAAHHHISVRHLQRLFQAEGTTVNGWIRGRRLKECGRELSRPRRSRPAVSAVGLRQPRPLQPGVPRRLRHVAARMAGHGRCDRRCGSKTLRAWVSGRVLKSGAPVGRPRLRLGTRLRSGRAGLTGRLVGDQQAACQASTSSVLGLRRVGRRAERFESSESGPPTTGRPRRSSATGVRSGRRTGSGRTPRRRAVRRSGARRDGAGCGCRRRSGTHGARRPGRGVLVTLLQAAELLRRPLVEDGAVGRSFTVRAVARPAYTACVA